MRNTKYLVKHTIKKKKINKEGLQTLQYRAISFYKRDQKPCKSCILVRISIVDSYMQSQLCLYGYHPLGKNNKIHLLLSLGPIKGWFHGPLEHAKKSENVGRQARNH